MLFDLTITKCLQMVTAYILSSTLFFNYLFKNYFIILNYKDVSMYN